MHETFNFNYGNKIICCTILRHKNASNKSSIKVMPNSEVIVRTFELATTNDIRKLLTNKANWVYQQLAYFKERNRYVITKNYVSGEMMFYLGKHYVLKVLPNSTEDFKVRILGNRLQVNLQGSTTAKQQQVKQLLKDWYKLQASEVFATRLAKILPEIDWLQQAPTLYITVATQKWGSYSSSGKIGLNLHLVKAPAKCIDYIIVHELCHAAEKNHNKKFWQLVTQTMPDWRQAKKKLDDMAELYLNE